ncbi:DoxX family protein [Baekduia soli]|uniref:DoxX family protein n=1 Tax=Baekduia soli TaxID=496014 RepID=A0A5B8U8E1_9ACTN|nr:DoxX family protein [Baekduia soli]QEC49389.1 DoxX family protein [Baekduia soli]
MSLTTTALRGVIGPLFVGHGTQKLFGWFGGQGPDATGGFFEQLGLRPGRRNAIAAGAAEAGGGVLLTLGAFTPLAATLVSSTMITAIRKVHAPKGPWVTEQGWEYNAVLIAAVTALAEHGPGRPSVDARLLPGFKGRGWALASLGAAVAGSYLVDVLSEPAASTEPPASPNGAAPAPETAGSTA